MNRRTAILVIILAVSLLWPMGSNSQTQLFCSGVIKWANGTPAMGLEVQLVGHGQVRARAFTNQAGLFAFFGLPGQPSQYTLKIFQGSNFLRDFSLQGVPVGGQVNIPLR